MLSYSDSMKEVVDVFSKNKKKEEEKLFNVRVDSSFQQKRRRKENVLEQIQIVFKTKKDSVCV